MIVDFLFVPEYICSKFLFYQDPVKPTEAVADNSSPVDKPTKRKRSWKKHATYLFSSSESSSEEEQQTAAQQTTINTSRRKTKFKFSSSEGDSSSSDEEEVVPYHKRPAFKVNMYLRA